MRNLKSFIFGIITIVCALPILESITDIICGFLEKFKAKNTIKIMKLNKEIEDLQYQLEPTSTQAIGFEVPSEEYYEDDDWEEDKLKIGFR